MVLHVLQFFFAPQGQPWYAGAVWGNVIAIVPCGVLGWLWSKTKFWPLNLLHQRVDELHEKHDALHAKHSELLARHDALMASHDELHTKLDSLAGGSGPETSNS